MTLPASYADRHAERLAIMQEAAARILADGRITPDELPTVRALLAGLGRRYTEAEWIAANEALAAQQLRRGPGQPCPAPRLARRLRELHENAPLGSDPNEAVVEPIGTGSPAS